MMGRFGGRDDPDPLEVLEELGAEWSPDFDTYASGKIPLSQVRCVLCRTAPCSCARCDGCGMTVPPGRCRYGCT